MHITVDDRYPGPASIRHAHFEQRARRLEDDLGRPLAAITLGVGLDDRDPSRCRVRMVIRLTATRTLEVVVSRRWLPVAIGEAFDVALVRLRAMAMREPRAPVLPIRGLPLARAPRVSRPAL
jgi:hypothetical protein